MSQGGGQKMSDVIIGWKEILKIKGLSTVGKITPKSVLKLITSDEAIMKKFKTMAKNSKNPEDVMGYAEMWCQVCFGNHPQNEAQFRSWLNITRRRMMLLNQNLTLEMANKLAMWKLKWRPLNLIPTFSETEKELRMKAAAMGFIIARETGRLDKYKIYDAEGNWEWSRKGDIYTTQVLMIARMFVNNTMFGMNPSHLPMGLTGSGRFWGQYKQYTWNQVIFEKK